MYIMDLINAQKMEHMKLNTWISSTDIFARVLRPLINLLAPELFFILAHSVYKMWIIHELNTLELWNKLHFEEKKTESICHV